MSRTRKYRVRYAFHRTHNRNLSLAGVAKLEAKGAEVTPITGPSLTSDYRCGRPVNHPIFGTPLPCVLDNRHLKNGIKRCAFDPGRYPGGTVEIMREFGNRLADNLVTVMRAAERTASAIHGLTNYDVLEIER